MNSPSARLVGMPLTGPLVCDAQASDGQRFDEIEAANAGRELIGRWPSRFELAAVRHRVSTLGESPSWDLLAGTPAVADSVRERADLLPLDRAILSLLPHLQHVCQRPRLYLRVDEERLPISRARRIPPRAIADLVSHPGDWEHRTLRSIQPSRVLARTLEDEWSIYENRVAIRLVDHLLGYLAQRLDELREIDRRMAEGLDHSSEARTSFRRARRVMTLWAEVLNDESQGRLREVVRQLELAFRNVQALLDSDLYAKIPRKAAVGLTLKSTNVLINDPHYRKIARLWRLWVKFGHRREETRAQRLARRQREGAAWDQFALLLIVRALAQLGAQAASIDRGWRLRLPGFSSVDLLLADGVVELVAGANRLQVLPLCADLAGADGELLTARLRQLDELDGQVVLLHCGAPAPVEDVDRATGWSFGRRATLLGVSPWRLDAEECIARLLAGWLNENARASYPPSVEVPGLPALPSSWGWVEQTAAGLMRLRRPSQGEVTQAAEWLAEKAAQAEADLERRKRLRGGISRTSVKSLRVARPFLTDASGLAHLEDCTVCGGSGEPELRPGVAGNEPTWWTTCTSCRSSWGLRRCTNCGHRFRALQPEVGLDLDESALASNAEEWPDKYLGRDVWAQPCARTPAQFRCPNCGTCERCGADARCGG